MSNAELLKRLERVERQVQEIALKVDADGSNGSVPWWDAIRGSVPNDALTRRAENYGRQYRRKSGRTGTRGAK